MKRINQEQFADNVLNSNSFWSAIRHTSEQEWTVNYETY